MSSVYLVRWDSLALPGFVAIPKSSGFSTCDAACIFADKLIAAGKVNVSIEAPAKRLTFASARLQAAEHNVVIRKVEGEYQVRLNEWLWSHAGVYFTDDIQDALDTAKAMREHVKASNPVVLHKWCIGSADVARCPVCSAHIFAMLEASSKRRPFSNILRGDIRSFNIENLPPVTEA